MSPALPESIELDGQRFPLVVRRLKQSRRMRLKIDARNDRVLMTLPLRCSAAKALQFWRAKEGWVRRCLQALPPRRPLFFGQTVPVLGRDLTIVAAHDSAAERENVLPVLATPVSCEATVKRLLIKRLRGYVEPLADRMAEEIGVTVARIAFRDTSSCWGSCTRDGRLMFSWRLVFAPTDVIDYLVAHEVAHLREMNHGSEFWALNAQLCEKLDPARAWLVQHGSRLHRYGSARI